MQGLVKQQHVCLLPVGLQDVDDSDIKKQPLSLSVHRWDTTHPGITQRHSHHSQQTFMCCVVTILKLVKLIENSSI